MSENFSYQDYVTDQDFLASYNDYQYSGSYSREVQSNP
jgi:hypothetical protein